MIYKQLKERAERYKNKFREWKYTGKIEGIAKVQKPKNLVVGSPEKALHLKRDNEIPGTTFAVSVWNDIDEIAKASIYYATKHLKIENVYIAGEVKKEIIAQLKTLVPHGYFYEGGYKKIEDVRGIAISCSDSRVLDNAIFNNDSNDTVVINNAGNLFSKTALLTIRHYLENSKLDFIAVLAHSNCGAVNAACLGNLISPPEQQLSTSENRTWRDQVGNDERELQLMVLPIQLEVKYKARSVDEIKEVHYLKNARGTMKKILENIEDAKKLALFIGYHDLNTGETEYYFYE